MNGSLGTMPLAPKIVATATQQDQKNYKLMRAATPFFGNATPAVLLQPAKRYTVHVRLFVLFKIP